MDDTTLNETLSLEINLAQIMSNLVVDERAPLLRDVLVEDEPASRAIAPVGNIKVFGSLAKDSVPGACNLSSGFALGPIH